jgi:hypothetical protein
LPLKSGSDQYDQPMTTRDRVFDTLANELMDRRTANRTLVDVIFEKRVPLLTVAQPILRQFLDVGLISVCVGSSPVESAHYDDAIKKAIERATGLDVRDPYRWTWHKFMKDKGGNRGSEDGAAFFFNVVATAAFTSAVSQGLLSVDASGDLPKPCMRFIVPPDRDRNLPLSFRDKQGCRPDVMGISCDAFFQHQTDHPSLYQEPNNHYKLLKDQFPKLFDFQSSSESESRGDSKPIDSNSGIDKRRSTIDAFSDRYEDQQLCDHLDLCRVCWPEAELTLEAKYPDSHRAILQTYDYIQQQRRTQPWMRFVLGLFATDNAIGLLRADPIGVEQCVLNDDDGMAAIETIRIALGLVLSSPEERGYHPSFELTMTTTPVLDAWAADQTQAPIDKLTSLNAVPDGTETSALSQEQDSTNIQVKHEGHGLVASEENSASSDPTNSGTLKRVRSSSDPFSDSIFIKKKKTIPTAPQYGHRKIRFIRLRNENCHPQLKSSSTTDESTFYVHYIIDNRGSVTGRCARIFCVSRQIMPGEPGWDQYFTEDEQSGACFLGPYALKMYYAPRGSSCYEDDLINQLRNKTTSPYILLPMM